MKARKPTQCLGNSTARSNCYDIGDLVHVLCKFNNSQKTLHVWVCIDLCKHIYHDQYWGWWDCSPWGGKIHVLIVSCRVLPLQETHVSAGRDVERGRGRREVGHRIWQEKQIETVKHGTQESPLHHRWYPPNHWWPLKVFVTHEAGPAEWALLLATSLSQILSMLLLNWT